MFSEVVVSYGLFLTAERETNKKTTKSRCQINSNNSFRMKRNSSYLLNSLSRDKVSVKRTEQKSKSVYQSPLICSRQFIFETCSLRELCPLIFETQEENRAYRNQELPTRKEASATAELLYVTIFQRNFGLQNLYRHLQEKH